MAVGRARTKTTQTFFHRSQSLLVGENDGGRVTTEEREINLGNPVDQPKEDERGEWISEFVEFNEE